MADNKISKIFNDSVHGHIEMPPLLVKIIDTPEFQRLRNIKQLGGGYYVFPGASHNRFEHSIGVAHLAGEMVKSLRAHQGLEITKEEELCVQIAGLCHDLGHGPFSHAFDMFLKKKNTTWKHEKRSVDMFKHLIVIHELQAEMVEKGLSVDLITDLIDSHGKNLLKDKDKPYLYEIVANSRTGIDVDKMDYFIRDCHHLGMKCNFSHERYMKFARVCTDENGQEQICMRDKEAMNMYELFHVRNLLHHNAYQHRVTKAVELMIVDALDEADSTLSISAAAEKPEAFATFTDDILQKIQDLAQESKKKGKEEGKIIRAQEIINRIYERRLYKFIGSKLFEPNELKHLDNNDKWEAKLKQWLGKVDHLNLKTEHFKVVHVTLDYGMKEKNPIDALRFYRKDDPNTAIQLSKDEVSYLLPEKFAEIKVMVFYTEENQEIIDLTKEHIKEFWYYLDPTSEVVYNDNIYMDLSVGSNTVLQQILHSSTRRFPTAEDITERTLKHGSYKLIAEKIFQREKLEHLVNAAQWKVKVNDWLTNVQQLIMGRRLTVTVEDFEVVQYSLSAEPESVQVDLLYKGLPEEVFEEFWKELLKHLKDMLAIIKKPITYMDLIGSSSKGGIPRKIICLQLSVAQEIIYRLLKQGFFIIIERIFKAEHLEHMDNDECEGILKNWISSIQKKTGGQWLALTEEDFRLVSYALPGQTVYVNVMLFYKGIPKLELEKFWDEVPKVPQLEASPSKKPKI